MRSPGRGHFGSPRKSGGGWDDSFVVLDDDSWREETLKAAYTGYLSDAAMRHEIEHLRRIRASRERRLEETRRQVFLKSQLDDPHINFLLFVLLFTLGSYTLGISTNAQLLTRFLFHGQFVPCTPEEGFACTLNRILLLVGYIWIGAWGLWVWKLKGLTREYWSWFLGAVILVGVAGLAHYGMLEDVADMMRSVVYGYYY